MNLLMLIPIIGLGIIIFLYKIELNKWKRAYKELAKAHRVLKNEPVTFTIEGDKLTTILNLKRDVIF